MNQLIRVLIALSVIFVAPALRLQGATVVADLSNEFDKAKINPNSNTMAIFASSSCDFDGLQTNYKVSMTNYTLANDDSGQVFASSSNAVVPATYTAPFTSQSKPVYLRGQSVQAYTSEAASLSKPPGGKGNRIQTALTSTSVLLGPYSGSGSVSVEPSFPVGVHALATKDPTTKRAGSAAAAVFDPFTFVSLSPVPYTPEISFTIELDEGDSGGLTIFAYDSSTYSTPDDAGALLAANIPLGNVLWKLNVDRANSTSPIQSAGDLLIDFELNSAALNEMTIPGISGPSDHSGILDFEAQTNNAIRQKLTFSSSGADLTDFDVFPTGTTYTPQSLNEEFGDGTVAALTGVPEPTSVSLLVLAALMVHCRSRRSRL